MTDEREPKVAAQFSQPVSQIISMLIVLGLVGGVVYIGYAQLFAIYESNPTLNMVILLVFAYGVFSCIRQVVQLMWSVRWIEEFARDATSDHANAPSLLQPLATLMRSRGARTQISSTSAGSILDSVGQRIDEAREITRYVGNLLIFLGLLGTFYGLATTVPALVETIRSLNPAEGENGADIFGRLQAGLEAQLGGMGTAFSSSLLGLAGSLIVGLLEILAGRGQNRFYSELEEWLSTITRLGFATGDEGGGDSSILASFADHLAEQMDAMRGLFASADANRAHVDEQLAYLAVAVERMGGGEEQNALLTRVAEGQERLIEKLSESGMEGIDAESRMRLRSIDVQLLRILEEMSAGRQETIADLRSDIAGLSRAIKTGRGRPTNDGL